MQLIIGSNVMVIDGSYPGDPEMTVVIIFTLTGDFIRY